jgi:hypothetical protein
MILAKDVVVAARPRNALRLGGLPALAWWNAHRKAALLLPWWWPISQPGFRKDRLRCLSLFENPIVAKKIIAIQAELTDHSNSGLALAQKMSLE